MPEKTIIDALQWGISILAGIMSTWAVKNNLYWRNRNIELENRVTKVEASQVSEEKVQEMINNSNKEMASFVHNLKENQDKTNESVDKLTVSVTELAIITGILKEKIK